MILIDADHLEIAWQSPNCTPNPLTGVFYWYYKEVEGMCIPETLRPLNKCEHVIA
jgi:hypothetical protein